MPLLRVGDGAEAVDICYQVYGGSDSAQNGSSHSHSGTDSSSRNSRPPSNQINRSYSLSEPCVVLIMGFAAGQGGWTPQLHGLLHPYMAGGSTNVRVLTMDNRGVGRSSAPRPRDAYSTAIMAKDVLALMDHLGWPAAHIVGHSMGGMIAMRLAVEAPDRVQSLTLISATCGGWQALPFSWRAAKYMWRAVRAGDRKERAKVDLKFHFMRDTLRKYVFGRKRKEMLVEEYTGVPDDGSATEGQPKWAMQGQLSAIWKHSISKAEFEALKGAPYPKQVIHGRYDILAAPSHAESLARKLHCRCSILEGAHFITRECGPEINALLRSVIFPTQSLEPDHYMARDVEKSVVSSFRKPSVEIESAVEMTEIGEAVVNGLQRSDSCPAGASPTASSLASISSTTPFVQALSHKDTNGSQEVKARSGGRRWMG